MGAAYGCWGYYGSEQTVSESSSDYWQANDCENVAHHQYAPNTQSLPQQGNNVAPLSSNDGYSGYPHVPSTPNIPMTNSDTTHCFTEHTDQVFGVDAAQHLQNEYVNHDGKAESVYVDAAVGAHAAENEGNTCF